MPSCFVIQPFDGGRFDKRYTDIFQPAIKAAGLEPYRVDRDPSVSIPINEIEQGIHGAAVCFAEITLDNPNVWFELGYAIAAEKEICMICSKEREGKFPFDVQHRNIIPYGVDSPSDFGTLGINITARLKAMQEKAQKLAAFTASSPLKEAHGLSQHEQIVLATMLENRDGPGEAISHFVIKNGLDVLGFNNMAVNIGVERLLHRGMISVTHEEDQNGNRYNRYMIEGFGISWLSDNYESLNLSSSPKARTSPKQRGPLPPPPRDDDIPF